MKGAIAHRRREEVNRAISAKAEKKKNLNGSVGHEVNAAENDDTRELRAEPVLGDYASNEDEMNYLISTEKESRNATLSGFAGRKYQNWESLTARLLRTGYWSRLGDLAKSLNALPEDIESIFNKLGKNMEHQIDSVLRLHIYKDFIRTALGSMVLRFGEVETLIERLKLADHISRVELYNLMNSKLEGAQKGDEIDFFDFELFASVVCDLYDEREKMSKVSPNSMRTSSPAMAHAHDDTEPPAPPRCRAGAPPRRRASPHTRA